MPPQEVSVWTVIVAVLLPGAYVALSALWYLNMKAFSEITKLRSEAALTQVENERRFVTQQIFGELKSELGRRFDRLETKIDSLPHKPSSEL